MQTIHSGYRGLSLLMEVNSDRVLYIVTIALALGAGAWVGTVFG